MIISCVACNGPQFTVNPNDVQEVGIITFVCPSCGKTTAVQEREGGGVTVALEDRTKWPAKET